MTIAFPRAWLAILLWPAFSCSTHHSPNKEMTNLLQTIAISENVPGNPFASERKKLFYDSLLQAATIAPDSASASFRLANTLLELGQEDKAIELFENVLQQLPPYLPDNKKLVMKSLAIAYLRQGERTNCIYNHTGESCIYPIANRGIHVNKQGAEKAIELYSTLLRYDGSDLESRWLLNIAYMATGGYPQAVPPKWLITLPHGLFAGCQRGPEE